MWEKFLLFLGRFSLVVKSPNRDYGEEVIHVPCCIDVVSCGDKVLKPERLIEESRLYRKEN